VTAAALDEGLLERERASVAALGFGALIGETAEPNTPPGGMTTVDTILRFAQLRPGSAVLEVGCATGPTVHEIAACRRDVRASGIDVDAQSIRAAQEIADAAGLPNARFAVGDALDIRSEPGAYDLVLVGNVPAFVTDRAAMIAECCRVLAPHGMLAAVPMYYVETPPDSVRERVEKMIGAPIQVWDEGYWLDLYQQAGLTLRGREAHRFARVPAARRAEYASWVMGRPVNDRHSPERRQALEEALAATYELFEANLACLGYSILLYRKAIVNGDPILFTAAE
jgi:SAM-dependent methyltransferase